MSTAFLLRIFGGRATAAQALPMSHQRVGTPGRHSSPAPESSQPGGDGGEINFDLTREDASLEARREGFTLLNTSAARPASSDRRQAFYDTITIPAHHSIADFQIGALDTLTNGGRNLAPFESELVTFLNQTLKELSTATERAREETRGNRPRAGGVWGDESPHREAERNLPSREPSGAEKGFLDTFYLIANIITRHRKAFHEPQLEILLTTVTNIAKTTTMRRALRGCLKILSAVTAHVQIPKTNLKPSVVALCSVFGSATFKFSEEAWTCLSNLLRFEDCQAVGDILIGILLNRPDISEVRNQAKYRGALLSVQRIAENGDLTASVTSNLHLLLQGLEGAHSIDSQSALETLQAIEALLHNNAIAQLLVHEKWDIIHHLLDDNDNSISHSNKALDVAGSLAEITRSSPLYDFVHADFTSSVTVDFKTEEILGHLAERILYLQENEWQTLDKAKLLLALRVLLHLARYVPSVWAPAIEGIWNQGLLEPANDDWRPHLGILVAIATSSPPKPELAQRSILQNFRRLHPLLRHDTTKYQYYESHLRLLCQHLRAEKELTITVIDSMAALVAEIGGNISSETFEALLASIEEKLDLATDNADGSTLNVPEYLVRLFLLCFQQSFSKTTRVYQVIMKIAATSKSTNLRLLVMKLLTRIRCNADYAIKVIALPAPEDLAANLCRTQTSTAAFDPIQMSSNRPSMYGQIEPLRTGRSSAIDSAMAIRSRSATRSMNAKDRDRRVVSPLWMHDSSIKEFPIPLPVGPSLIIYAQKSYEEDTDILDLGLWLDLMIDILKGRDDWELYSYVLVHLPLQLSNYSLLSPYVKSLQILQNTVVIQLNSGDFQEPPKDSGIKKGDVALCLYQILIILLPYHESFSRRMTDDTVRTFRIGIEKWDRTGKCCIHALALCCYEIPSHVEKQIVGITEMMQKRITQADLAMDILEFLGCLSRLREAYGEADTAFYRRIFGICIRYLQVAWEQRQRSTEAPKSRASTQFNRQSGSSSETARTSGAVPSKETQGLSEYVYILAYQTIIYWFLAIDVYERAQHVGWLTQELSWKDDSGKDHIEEQSLVILDMMHRTAFSNLGETEIGPDFDDPTANIVKRMWLVGMSIVTVEVATDAETGFNRCGQLTKRQASGTTHATYYHNTAEIPSHHIEDDSFKSHSQQPLDVYPNHMFLQLTSTIAPTPIPLQPIPLPDDDFTRRAIKVFDGTDTVDGHKAGVIYVGEGQTTEAEILANIQGTDSYENFLSGLGTKVPLKGTKFNAQGLDRRSEEDGTHTYAWRDRVTEIVFHVPTMMPTDLLDDPQGDKKKRHVGNDHIKIIFNASGQPFDFNTFASALNTVNIVITPEAHSNGKRPVTDRTIIRKGSAPLQEATNTDRFGFYNVQALFSPAYPQFSIAAGIKVISADALPAFVRQMAITCSVFCQVWENSIIRDSEFISSWRARLQEVIRLRKKYANTNTSANVHYPMSGAESTAQYAEGDTWTGAVTTGGMADADKLLNSLDFTRWT